MHTVVTGSILRYSCTMFAVVLLTACSSKELNRNKYVNDTLQQKTLICLVNQIDILRERKSYSIEEFDEINTNDIYYSFFTIQTKINGFLTGQGFNDIRLWRNVDKTILSKNIRYNLIEVLDTSSAPVIRYPGLNIHISKPVQTDSCYYVHASYEAAFDTTHENSPYIEGIVCKFTLDKDITSYYLYAGIE